MRVKWSHHCCVSGTVTVVTFSEMNWLLASLAKVTLRPIRSRASTSLTPSSLRNPSTLACWHYVVITSSHYIINLA